MFQLMSYMVMSGQKNILAGYSKGNRRKEIKGNKGEVVIEVGDKEREEEK